MLMVSPGFPSAKRPGRMRFTLEQARALRRAGVVLTVVDDQAESEGWDQVEGLPVLRLPHLGSFRQAPAAAVSALARRRTALRGLRTQRFDAELISFADHKHWSILGPTVRPRGLVVHGVDVMHPELTSPRGLGARLLMESAHAIFAVSGFTADLACRWLPRRGWSKVRINYNGVELNKLSEARALTPSVARARLGWDATPVILCVANLVPRKGIDVLLRAVARLLKDGPQCRLVIVGGGPEEQALRSLACSLGLTDAVVFEPPRLDDADLAARFAGCNVFAMLSKTVEHPRGVEGFGIAFAEAQAVGRPVVAGRGGGVPEVVRDGETGLLVEPEDDEAAATALRALLTDADLAERMGRAGRAWVERRFSWEDNAESIMRTLLR